MSDNNVNGMPELVFGEAAAAEPVAEAVQINQPEDVQLPKEELTPEEQKAVDAFADKIDITDSASVLQFGASAQQKIASFSESALNGVKMKDFGEVGDMITGLVVELKNLSLEEDEKKGFKGFFKRQKVKGSAVKSRYESAEKNVDGIVETLENHQLTLLKDIAMLDKMYEMNLGYFKELTMYIVAGKQKLDREINVTLAEMKKKAAATGAPQDAQAANDYENQCLRFERKLHDLELTRTICMQMAPQIRLVQNNNTVMTEKIQSVIVSTIPLWKNQMVLSLGLHHSEQAMAAQRAVTDITNDLLKNNADKLKQSSVDIARESERGIVDLETLKYTNEQLIATLDEVQSIQTEGRAKRQEAEKELVRIETELKTKLLHNAKQA